MDYQFHTFPKEYPPVICDSYSVARGWLKEFLKTNKHVNYGIFELKYECFFNKEFGTPIIKVWNDEGELIPQGPV